MRFCRAIAGHLLLLSLMCPAQDELRVVSSNALPKGDNGNLWGEWQAGRLGCGQNRTLLVALGHGGEREAPIIGRVSADGTLLATVDSEKVPGLGKTSIEDFVLGPGDDIYLIARRILKQYFYRDDQGRSVRGGRADYLGDWLVRYDKNGAFLDKKEISAASTVRFAVFSSGELLILSYGTTRRGYVLLSDLPLSWMAFAGIFSPDGVLLHSITLPDFFIDSHSGRPRIPWPVPLPMTGADGNVYVVKEGEAPAVAVISRDGTVLRSTTLAIPHGQVLRDSRILGSRLLAQTAPAEFSGRPEQSFAEFDTETGSIVAYYRGSSPWYPVCDLGSGLSAINPVTQTLDVLEPAPSNEIAPASITTPDTHDK